MVLDRIISEKGSSVGGCEYQGGKRLAVRDDNCWSGSGERTVHMEKENTKPLR